MSARRPTDVRRGSTVSWLAVALVAGAAFGAPTLVLAHAGDPAFVHILPNAADTRVLVDVSVVTVDIEHGADSDGDGSITWGELRAAAPRVAAAVARRLQFEPATCRLPATAEPALVDRAGGRYLRLAYSLDCAAMASSLDARAWFAVVPEARVYLVEKGDAIALTRALPRAGLWGGTERNVGERRLRAFFVDGAVHLVTGYDHVAFLAILLIGATLIRATPPTSREALLAAAGIVTAFTVAHSLTLSLAVLGVVRLPPGPVEAAIAATVLATAVGTGLRLGRLHAWPVAFAFGLVHGFGFASVLGDMLAGNSLLGPLLAFNLGIEAAQLALVALALPLLLALARRPAIALRVARGASAAVAVLAVGWLWQRVG